jgi:hypothetical protein
MQLERSAEVKRLLWDDFAATHKIANQCVPLFDIFDKHVMVVPYGRNGRHVLKRSSQMESLMRDLGRKLIDQHSTSNVTHDGILYMMLSRERGKLVPLYIGKTETFGKRDRNLSANISDLATGNGKFGRWGYSYAYHLGDLSAVTCSGHPDSKSTIKYTAWRDRLFDVTDTGGVLQKNEIMFWAKLWGPKNQSIWRQYGSTNLAFEEYLLIGVASDVFPSDLLNREGRTR